MEASVGWTLILSLDISIHLDVSILLVAVLTFLSLYCFDVSILSLVIYNLLLF